MCVRRKARRFEVGRQPDLQHVDFFFGRAESLRVRAAQRHQRRVETVPDSGIGVAAPARIDRHARNPRQVRQRRHVHDRHARHPGLCHRVEQLAYAGRTILGLLHRQRHQVVVRGPDRAWKVGGKLARQLARVDLDQPVAAFDRHAHPSAFLVDQLGLGREAYELDRVSREQKLGRQEGAVRGAQDENLVGGFHDVKYSPAGRKTSLLRSVPDFMLQCRNSANRMGRCSCLSRVPRTPPSALASRLNSPRS